MSDRYAFVDESHVAATAHYLLAAVIGSEASAEALSAATAAVRRRGRAPFHWYHELDVSRTAMIRHIAGSSDLQVVVISRPVAQGRHERARARCMESLLAQLQSLDPPVRHVVFESRTQVLDKRDAAQIEGMRSSLRLLPALRFSFETKEQPHLWLADAVAGAESAHVQGDSRYVDLLKERLIRVRTPRGSCKQRKGQEIAGGGGQPVVAVGMGMALVLGGVAALVVAVRRLARQLDSIESRGVV